MIELSVILNLVPESSLLNTSNTFKLSNPPGDIVSRKFPFNLLCDSLNSSKAYNSSVEIVAYKSVSET